MKREPFVAARKGRWGKLESLLLRLDGQRKGTDTDLEELPRLYRLVCQDLALARHRMYGRELVQRLNQLALRGREQLYSRPTRYLREFASFFGRDFPRLVRADARLFWICTLLFVAPLVGTAVLAHERPDLLYTLMSPEQLQQYEEMYDPGQRDGITRSASQNVTMFAFYIRNNVGIDFQIFSSGLVFGIGSILSLIYNGVHFGAILGHFLQIGYQTTLLPFVVGHSSFELIAMVIAAVAGMRLGSQVIAPGRRSRTRALVEEAPRCLRLLVGAAAMTTLAAFIEGFWSAQPLPSEVKYAVGAAIWVLCCAWLLFAGRRDAA
ncbi:MAG: stage II sporulation protein M [Planctomycetota bacterium]|nr:stage II sporulation protein M [Planctomycetota bacterium]